MTTFCRRSANMWPTFSNLYSIMITFDHTWSNFWRIIKFWKNFGAVQKCDNHTKLEHAAKRILTSKIGFDTAEDEASKVIFLQFLNP